MNSGWHPTQAVGPDGQRADVKDVANGLQCRCVCFECGQPVMAKQGTIRRWYFAHHAPTTCRPTAESELHFFAKTLLGERLCLWIPAVHAKAAGRSKLISEGRQYAFAKVRVDKDDGNVRPDLRLVAARETVLHVEIFVRHRVDPIKLQKLINRDISSVEIDLSKLDWDDRSGWEAAILETAPRAWLHNARAAKAEREIEAQAAFEARRKQDVLDAEFERVVSIWEDAQSSTAHPDEDLVAEHKLARERGFAHILGRAVEGAQAFQVAPIYWQSRLANRFLWEDATASPWAFETAHALAHVRDLLRPGFNAISKETEARMQREFPSFQNPWHVVHSYLKWLKDRHWMFDKRVTGKRWLLSSSAWHHRKEKENAWRREIERKSSLADWVGMILSNVPNEEAFGFDQPRWVEWFASAYDEDEARSLLEAVYDMVIGGRGLADDLLDLPLAAERERQGISQQSQRIEAKRMRLAKLECDMRAHRISAIQNTASCALETNVQDWLHAANEQVGGRSPLEVSSEDDAGLALAVLVLGRLESDRRENTARETALARQHAEFERNRLELTKLAQKRARDPVRADLWCRSPHPSLGGQRPIDYCVDERALHTCKEILPTDL